jgi:hypothetical protein
MRIVLADLPAALKNVRAGLARYGLTERIELVGVDVFDYPWKIPECDGIFLGNFLHGFPDDACMRVCREGFERLRPGGKLWVHEMLWNANKDGPLITSLWNASMRASGGKQRSAAEYVAMLQGAGFSATHTVPTAAAFTLVAGRKPICHGERTRCCAH